MARRSASGRLWFKAVASDIGWRWVVLGFAGTTILSLTAPFLISRFEGIRFRWWYKLPGGLIGSTTQQLAAYVGLAAVLGAWVGVGARLRSASSSGPVRSSGPVLLAVPALAWALPLLVGPPMFSRDLYSYIAQARLAGLGLSPYTNGPLALIGSPGGRLFVKAVSPVWRNSVAPYGPLFLWSSAKLLELAGRNLVTAALIVRLPSLVGIALTFIFLPRLARSCGVDARLALWLGVLSPLTMFDLLSAGHNDALMIGLMIAALAVASRSPAEWWAFPVAISLSAAGAMVKLPAGAVCAALAVAWVKDHPVGEHAARRVVAALGTVSATVVAISALSGLGFGWMSPSVLLTPTGGFIASTPASAFGSVVAGGARLRGLHATTSVVQRFAWYLIGAGALGMSLVLLVRCRRETLASTAASVMALMAVAAPALWPWYLTWGLVVLAATAAAKTSSFAITAGVLLWSVALAPDGEVLPPSGLSWVFATLWLAAGLYVLSARRRSKGGRHPSHRDGSGPLKTSIQMGPARS